ncbi:hypothetical protein [Microvirga calopogonii]|uniref:hypothetical protein n=1 Tax=Microvirga calopogonii TaxID=2078013 RepID=UPI0013B37B6F|nr:hypothetical protein [Microvirga calopogonii]
MALRLIVGSLPLRFAPAGNDIRDVITGLVPVIPVGKAPRFTSSGWPGQARP